ncbi:MAG TPA: GNAT family N-acetyltransferase [Gemmatimonadaceae bacterium]|nr:GNAT family N-acetyltransferase [Gemmatimonadaceae bacterium]
MTARGYLADVGAELSLGRETTSCTIEPMADRAEWDAFATVSSRASFAHLAKWGEIIADSCGHEARYAVARDERGEVVAILPLIFLRSRLFGRRLISVPFLNYGGPAGSPPAELALVRHAEQLAARVGATSLELRTRHAIDGVAGDARKVTVLLDLPPSVDEMWMQRFNAKLRTKIKRPMRDHMQTRFGASQLRAFHEVWSHNMRDLGTPTLPLSFFERIVGAFPDLVLIGATWLGDRPVAAGFGFVWGNEFEMTWSSALSEFGAAKPNMLLYWDFMRTVIERGVRCFNFGRSTPGSGPHDFKLAWGGEDAPLPWIEWPGHAGGDSRNGRAMGLAVAAWQRLPLAVANRVGPIVSPRLPWW